MPALTAITTAARAAGRLARNTGRYLGRIADSATRLTVDAVQTTQRRRPPLARTRDEDSELYPLQRDQLVTTSRDLERNFSIAGWAIRKHLDYVSTFSFQSRTGDKGRDRQIEDWVKTWSRPGNFDISRRHSRERMTRLLEARRTVDGDALLVMLNTGNVQVIEADRIRTPRSAPPILATAGTINGVHVDEYGAALGYHLHNRGLGANAYTYDRELDARWCHLHAFYHRIDQVRGSSPLNAALNTFQDLYENFDYALAKAKIAQLFALAIYREDNDALGLTATVDREGDEGATPPASAQDSAATSPYTKKVSFNRGPFVLDLVPGDRAETIESAQPSTQFQAFCQIVTSAALKALDIPFSFYDESFTNYSGARQAWLQYEQSADRKREDVRELLNRLTAWRFWLATVNAEPGFPAGLDLATLRWDWTPAGIPWIDPLKEVQADAAALSAGLTSRTRIARERGQDIFEILDELAAEQEYIRDAGLVLPSAQPITSPPADEGGKRNAP